MTKRHPANRDILASVQQALSQQRLHSDLIRKALGPTNDARELALKSGLSEKIRLATESTDLIKAIDYEFTRRLVSPELSSAIRNVSERVFQYNSVFAERMRSLSLELDTNAMTIAKAFQNNSGILSATIQTAEMQSKFRSLDLKLNLSAFRAIAENKRFVEMTTLRASAIANSSTAQIVAEQALEAHGLLEALAQPQSPAESARLFAAVVTLLASLASKFKDNTVQELERAGLLTLLALLLSLNSCFPTEPAAELSDTDRAAFAEMRSSIDSLDATIQAILAADREINEEYVSSLPRGELNRRANIRSKATADSKKLLLADPGTPLAIIQVKEKWKQVVFRDPLSNQLAEGWVYSPYVTALSDD